MATFYTKTALKKMKKGDLVTMYLDLQSKVVDDSMDDDDVPEGFDELTAYQAVEEQIINDHIEIRSITKVNHVIKCLKKQLMEELVKIEKLRDQQTILANYRNCMNKIETEFEIEDIVDVLPFMKKLKEEKDALRQFAGEMYELMECCPFTGDDLKDFDYYVENADDM